MQIDKQSCSRNGTSQNLAYTGSSATVTNAFGAQCYQIRICATSVVFYKIVEGAAGGNAATTDVLLPANWVEYVNVSPGQKISAIQAGTNGLVTATAGTLNVVELS